MRTINVKTRDQRKNYSKSLSLEKYGLNDFAWIKEDAQNLIRAIMKNHIGIFGGDAIN